MVTPGQPLKKRQGCRIRLAFLPQPIGNDSRAAQVIPHQQARLELPVITAVKIRCQDDRLGIGQPRNDSLETDSVTCPGFVAGVLPRRQLGGDEIESVLSPARSCTGSPAGAQQGGRMKQGEGEPQLDWRLRERFT